MPDAKDNAKLTGDTHLADVDEELPTGSRNVRGKPTKPAGEIKDQESGTSDKDSDDDVRDSGERPAPG